MATACLWRVADIAATSPDPLWHPDGLTLFDASSVMLPDPTNARSIPVKVSRHLGNLLSAAVGSCRGLCQVSFLPRSHLLVAVRWCEKRLKNRG